jgi:putative chitinase
MDYSKLSSKLNKSVMDELPFIAEKFEINTPLRLAHFLSQCSHESDSFRLVNENMNYSAKRLMAVFPKYFPSEGIAKQYERQPQKIGNRVYANRMGNGDEASGDGYRYHGRGYIQLTGKENYKEFSKFIGEDCVANPDLIATKYPLASAAYFFKRNKLLQICDDGDTVDVVTKVSKKVNGGTIGLDDRIAKFKLYRSMIGT